MTKVKFALRAASAADVDDLLALWEEAAENSDRPLDTAKAMTALLGRDPEAVILAEHGAGSALLGQAEKRLRALGATRIDAMVLDGNDLGQDLWRANGYRRQDGWRRWVKNM